MEASLITQDKFQFVLPFALPYEIYSAHLELINNIAFTKREIDILAYLLTGRTMKKIASLLFISPKTVENHIRNITIKLNCHSKEGIIDFIESSGKLHFIKNYYHALLLQTNFEAELKKIALRNHASPNCTLVYEHTKEYENKKNPIEMLEKHLKLAGINLSIQLKEHAYINANIQSIEDHLNGVDLSKQHFVFYCSQNPNILNSKIETIRIYKVTTQNNEIKPQDLGLIDLTTNNNYYFFVYEILKNIWPEFDYINLTKLFDNFERLERTERFDENFTNTSPTISSIENNKNIKPFPVQQMPVQQMSLLQKYKTKNWKFITIVLICIAIISPFFVFTGKRATATAATINIDQNWNFPRQDHHFIGREAILKDLHKKFKRKDESNTLAISACSGMGGIGKTQLALQYALHSKIKYSYKFWLPSENIEHLRQKYLELAQALGYTEQAINIKNAISYLNKWFANHPGWLLVYDNANSYNEIAPFLPERGGDILLTTRNRLWPEKFQIVYLDVMTEYEAIHLLESIIQQKIKKETQTDAHQLVKLLGYLPLAIAQAGAYIRQNQLSITQYLELYRTHEVELLEDKSLAENSNGMPVAITWNITMASMIIDAKKLNEFPFEIELLTACSYLAPEKISRQLLLSWFKKRYADLNEPELFLNKLIAKLWKYSLINFDEDGYITIHRLVQTIVRHQNKSKVTNAWYAQLLSAVHDEFNTKRQTVADNLNQQNLCSHSQSLVKNYSELWPNVLDVEFGDILFDIGFVLLRQYEDPKIVRPYFERSLTTYEKKYGKDHPKIAAALQYLGQVHDDLGNIEQSKVLLSRALKIKEQYYGENHWEVAKVLTRLGRVHLRLGDSHSGIELVKKALQIQIQQYGQTSPIVAQTFKNLGNAYLAMGDPKLALESEQRALSIFEAIKSTEYGDLAITVLNIGRAYHLLGDPKQSFKFLIHALKIQNEHYDKIHWHTVYTLRNLGVTCHDLGWTKQEKKYLERAIKVEEICFGKDHWETAKTLTFLARTFGDLKNYEQQKLLLEKSLKIKEAYFSENHYEIARTLTFLGKAYNDLGDLEKAKTVLGRALKIGESYYGQNHYEVSETLNNLGETYLHLGELEQAKPLLIRALKIREQFYGEHHPKVATTLTKLSKIYLKSGEINEAAKLLSRSLKIQRAHFKKDHYDVVETLDLLETVQNQKKNHKVM